MMDIDDKWVVKILKAPVLFLWDKYEVDPALALGLIVVAGMLLSMLAIFITPWLAVLIASLAFGYVLLIVALAIIYEVTDD
jgi:hypothetical protein